ncbi:MAG: dTDP-4-dehydrorhamnose 3,5-epimerase [Cyanobacteria bacterium HKST-UBA04]|nr:dTDP-4-dehydrorhamnose 3,5-epimerase [Cyanobacteria bacterium HKST-UBA04]MCA9841735.1 dTDP-4-dehydrorhamnose 3,5-epimerase [Cyanobacteria bacterium HKST-UBA03]
MGFEFQPLAIPEVVLVTPQRFGDDRGMFMETFKASAFTEHGIGPFVQDNHSVSARGVLRGLHYQLNPQAQGKLVRCPIGKIWDVAVDIRQGSPTFGQWVAATLDDERHQMLWVPEGFAHGFVVLSDTAHVLYKTTREYVAELDRGMAYDDPTLGIDWPVDEPVLSDKDKRQPRLAEAVHNFTVGPALV